MHYRNDIASEPGKRGGRPCLGGTRIAVADVLGWLAAGVSHAETTADYPEVGEDEIRACLACAEAYERHLVAVAYGHGQPGPA